MEVELVTDETSDDENYGFDDTSEDYLNIEGERCGICMDVVIDRGVLDCCQHWFCFACIDNWATITSLCPLCQNEFQLITCVPVYDTVGGNNTDDDDSNPRDDDWFIEGKNNTLSFPAYYIDENAVVCLDGDGCKIRSGSVAIEEDSDIDTSIACDSCDKWYHAFCVGFDPEGSCDSSWLCPRCTLDKGPNTSFSGRVSVADDGETAVVISLLEENQVCQESSQSAVFCSKDMGNTLLPSSISSLPKLEELPGDRESVEPNSSQQGIEVTLSQDNGCSSSHAILPAELNTNGDVAVGRGPGHLNKKMIDSGTDLDHGIAMGSDTPDIKGNGIAGDKLRRSPEPNHRPEDLIPVVSNEKMVLDEMPEIIMPDERLATRGITGAKRKDRVSRNADGGRETKIEARNSRKKFKAGRNSQPIGLTNRTAASVPDVSSTIFRQSSSKEKGNSTSDIMDIVQETGRRSQKHPRHKNSCHIAPKERESAAGFRLKKIMRRPGGDKDSSVLVQELRKKIRAAVHNKPSEETGQNLFDPKLLDAFRAALAGSGAENREPTLDARAKRSLLQKGKIRESLTKKIYGSGGKRNRAWTRECEVEFWKHRCLKTSKPEKIQTLKSVLNVLRDTNSDHEKKMCGNEEEAKGSILSRVYLADVSVFPRKNDIKPVSDLNAVGTPQQNTESGLTEKVLMPLPVNQPDGNSKNHNILFQLKVTPSDGKEAKKCVKGVKSETVGEKKIPLEKDTACKSGTVKGDKRQWALEVLARRMAASGKNMQEKEEDSAILKGNYTLLAQLPKEMRPVLSPSRHNKIPLSIRQTQLYRLTEHLLQKANVSVVSRAAETELAVADAVNIEKQVADRSNSKLVYLNLCSQELSRRSDVMNSFSPKAVNNPCSNSECPSDGAIDEANNNGSDNNNDDDNKNSSFDLGVEEALKRAGLVSDSPPTSPNHPTEDSIVDNNNNQIHSPENSDDEGPKNVIEVDSHSELDIYGDFEYDLEDDFIGAGALNNICKPQPEPPKLKMLFSSLKPEKPNVIVGPSDHEETLTAGPLECQKETSTCGLTVDSGKVECLVRNSAVHNEEELSVAECEELYGPDKEPLIEKYPIAISVAPFEQMVNNGTGDNRTVTKSGQPSEDCMGNLEDSTGVWKLPPSDIKKMESLIEKEKAAKSDTKLSERSSTIMKKVEVYIKEHIRPLCKSGVITVEQYRWAVGKTTEKVMKYHSKEKNANFLIKEGEKVKKLAEQYVESSQQMAKA
ncbi:hypothetical protein OROMI_008953 [Orobanche minor]